MMSVCFNPIDPNEDTERLGTSTSPMFDLVGFNPIDPNEDTESLITRGASLSSSAVSIPSIRTRILKDSAPAPVRCSI